jgi:glycosyltransferase involved in cell wall biosynthesis
MEDSVPLLDAAGLDHKIVWEIGNPYISGARASMLRRALDAQADVIVFLDHDLSWRPPDILKLIETAGDVVAGTYRFKNPDKEEYMGSLVGGDDGRPLGRKSDGALAGHRIPAGFLKVTKEAVGHFMKSYPRLVYGPPYSPHVDLFNHGAHEGTWYGEDYAFSRNWLDCGGDLWVVPDMDIDHHHSDGRVWKGNLHKFLMREAGGE